MTKVNKSIVLKQYIEAGKTPSKDDFELKESAVLELKNGEILAQTLYLSVDPYFRGRMLPTGPGYAAPFTPGAPLHGSGVGKVIESKNSAYQVGDVLATRKFLDWPHQSFVILTGEEAGKYTKVDTTQFPADQLGALVGFLGMPGLTAYFGLLDKGKPKEGETLVVSGAAGACGSVAGQIGKIKGLRVIGIVGTQEKLEYVTKELGFDAAIIYKGKKVDQMTEELKHLAPKGVDIYYDNVGGDVSLAVLPLMNEKGRVPICGQISQYNEAKDRASIFKLPDPVESSLKTKNVQREFFLFFNYKDKLDEAWLDLFAWLRQGKLKNRETIYNGIEKVPESFVGLFSGDNIGKALIKL